MLKIALLSSGSGSGGLIKYINGFLAYKGENEVRVFCGGTQALNSSDSVKIIKTPYAYTRGRDLLFGRPFKSELVDLIDEFSPDVVIFMDGYIRSGLEKYKCVSILHNQLTINPLLMLQQKSPHVILGLIEARKAVLYTFKHADAIIFLSHASKNETDKKKYKYKSGKVVLFGQDEDCSAAVYPKNKNEMVYVSTGFPYKNHIRLIKALALLKEKSVDFHISFIGCEANRRIKKLIQRDDLGENVSFLGWLKHEDTLEMIKNAGIYIHPSLIESTSNGVLEGVLKGNTIVCSSLDVFKEALGENAYYFNPKNIENMANCIDKAIQKPIKLSQSCCNEILSKYSYEKGVKETFEYARQIAENTKL